VARASGRCLDVVRVLRITQGAPAVEAVALRCQAVLEALRGRSEAARRMVAGSRHMVEELGIAQQLLETDVFAGLIELLDGDACAAESCLRGAYEGLRERGLGIDAARAAALLGRALLAQGRAAEAEALSHQSEALAGDDLQAAIAWRGVRAEALARRGDGAAAIALARASVEIAATTDALLDHADARVALATALRAAGRAAEAESEERRAAELWEAKGATLLAERSGLRSTGAREPNPLRSEGVGAAAAEPRLANAAFRVAQLSNRFVSERNWDALMALRAPGWVQDDRRAIAGVKMSREDADANLQMFFEARWVRFDDTLIATRGDRLALQRVLMRGEFGSGGPVEYEYLAVGEIDEQGRATALVMLDPSERTAAHAELDARYHAGEAAPHAAAAAGMRAFHGAFAARDWAALETQCAEEIEVYDHRRLGWESLHGRSAYLDALRSLVELAPDTRLRLDHVELDDRRYLVTTVWEGTRDGGRFEEPSWMVAELDPQARVRRFDQYDLEGYDEALARFAEIGRRVGRVSR
jgi:hypothetical protein